MPVEIVYETHAPTTDNEAGVATGWLPGRLSEAGRRMLLVGHSATRWALSHLIDRVALEQLVTEPFTWQAGWHHSLPTPWSPQ